MSHNPSGNCRQTLIQFLLIAVIGGAIAGLIAGVVLLYLEHGIHLFQQVNTATPIAPSTETTTPTTTLTPTPTPTLTPTTTPTPTLPPQTLAPPSSPFTITIKNKLLHKVDIYINYESQGRLKAQTTKDFLFSAMPATVGFELVRPTSGTGNPLGDEMTGAYYQLIDGDTVTIGNNVDGTRYFYPRIENKSGTLCQISINDGLTSEKRPGGVGPGTKVFCGYYRLYSNSNVTLFCGDGKTYWWGIRGNTEGPPLSDLVQSPSGLLELVLDP